MTNGAQSAAGVATYRTMRELGARSPRSHAAIREPNELVVTYRYARAGDGKASANLAHVGSDGAMTLGSTAMTSLLRDAKCLQKNWQPNIARVRHVDLAADELIVATELVDGATLKDLFAFAAAKRAAGFRGAVGELLLPLPVIVRILVDVLAGLHGLHGLRDASAGTLGVIHGAVCPANIVVGKDGVARIINTLRVRPVKLASSSEAVSYGAPEALDVGGTSDLRTDVYAVGVILWEALSGRRLYVEDDPVRILARQREEDIERPALPAESPFARLTEPLLRALAFDPSLRFKTAGEMGAALRAVAGARLATGSVVAAQVAELAGDRIRARRIELDPSSSATRRRVTQATVQPETPPSSSPDAAASNSTATPAPTTIVNSAAVKSEATAPATAEFGPMSRRATIPPSALASPASPAPEPAEDAPPPSVREELSLRELMSSAPPVHASAMVDQTPVPPMAPVPVRTATPDLVRAPRPVAAPRLALAHAMSTPFPAGALGPIATPQPSPARSVPPKPPPPVPRKPAFPSRAPEIASANAPAPPAFDSVPSVVVAPESNPLVHALSVEPPRPFLQVAAPEPPRAPDPMFVRHVAPIDDDRNRDTVPPPARKRPAVLLACLIAVALLGTGLAVWTFAIGPTPRTTAMSKPPTAELPSRAVVAPAVALPPAPTGEVTATTNAGATEVASATPDQPPAPEATPTPTATPTATPTPTPPDRVTDPTKPAAPQGTAPPVQTAPVAPRPKKPYEPLGI